MRSATSQIRRPRASNERHCRAGARGELLERGGRAVVVVGDRQRRTVIPVVPELGIEPHHVRRGRTGQLEQLAEHVGHRHERRPDVERVAVARVGGELAADHLVALDQSDVVAGGGQPDGDREPTHATADHDGRGHVATRRAIAAAASGSIPIPPTVATSGSRK